MKVTIGKYVDWIGPYQIAEMLLFWLDKNKDDRVHDFGTWLANKKDGSDSLLTKVCQWVYNKKKRKIKIKIDSYDVWSMDSTLALIILPMLEQLKKVKHGAPCTEDSDVPEELRSTSAPPKENEWDIDEYHFKRWDWVLDEMIWAFSQLQPDCDWESTYHTGDICFSWETPKEGAVPHVFDADGYKAHSDRITNGMRLFGVYFRALWD